MLNGSIIRLDSLPLRLAVTHWHIAYIKHGSNQGQIQDFMDWGRGGEGGAGGGRGDGPAQRQGRRGKESFWGIAHTDKQKEKGPTAPASHTYRPEKDTEKGILGPKGGGVTPRPPPYPCLSNYTQRDTSKKTCENRFHMEITTQKWINHCKAGSYPRTRIQQIHGLYCDRKDLPLVYGHFSLFVYLWWEQYPNSRCPEKDWIYRSCHQEAFVGITSP